MVRDDNIYLIVSTQPSSLNQNSTDLRFPPRQRQVPVLRYINLALQRGVYPQPKRRVRAWPARKSECMRLNFWEFDAQRHNYHAFISELGVSGDEENNTHS